MRVSHADLPDAIQNQSLPGTQKKNEEKNKVGSDLLLRFLSTMSDHRTMHPVVPMVHDFAIFGTDLNLQGAPLIDFLVVMVDPFVQGLDPCNDSGDRRNKSCCILESIGKCLAAIWQASVS
jgi:hypothetical protein